MSDSREARAVTIQKARNLLAVQADGLALWTEAEQDEAGDVIESLLSLLADVLRSLVLEQDQEGDHARVGGQCDPTDSPTASPVAPVSTEVEGSLKIRDALLVVIESAFSCRICGIEDGDEHPSDLHDFKAIDVVALLLDELRGIGFDIRKRRVSHSDIPALVSEIRALCDENIGKAAIWAQFGYLRSKVRQLLMRLED